MVIKDQEKSREQFVDELATLRKKVAELEELAAEHDWVDKTLREREERYRAIVEAFDGLIYICSEDYRIEFMNEELITRTGYDATGEVCYRVLHERDSVCPWCVKERVLKGETVRWEIESPKDNRWYYVVNTPIYKTSCTRT